MRIEPSSSDRRTTRRAVALLHARHDPALFELLVRRYELRVVYTVRTDARPVLAALIGVQYALDRAADAVVVPHLGVVEADSPWRVVTDVCDLITGSRRYPLGWRRSAVVGEP